jgi:hypothetical protein
MLRAEHARFRSGFTVDQGGSKQYGSSVPWPRKVHTDENGRQWELLISQNTKRNERNGSEQQPMGWPGDLNISPLNIYHNPKGEQNIINFPFSFDEYRGDDQSIIFKLQWPGISQRYPVGSVFPFVDDSNKPCEYYTWKQTSSPLDKWAAPVDAHNNRSKNGFVPLTEGINGRITDLNVHGIVFEGISVPHMPHTAYNKSILTGCSEKAYHFFGVGLKTLYDEKIPIMMVQTSDGKKTIIGTHQQELWIQRPKKIYVLAGQNNGQGYAPINEVPSYISLGRRAQIWNATNNAFETMIPGNTQAVSNSAFGPEISIVHCALKDSDQDNIVYLIKHTAGGTNLDLQWRKGGLLYSTLAGKVNDAKTKFDSVNCQYRTMAFFWVQGESDSTTQDMSSRYQSNLTQFISDVRSDVITQYPPVIIVLVSYAEAWKGYYEVVRTAQAAVASTVPGSFLVETKELSRIPDGMHYDAESVIRLGQYMYETMYRNSYIDNLGVMAI